MQGSNANRCVSLLQDKSATADRPAVKRVIGESQRETDVMDTSEDELFISIPMPQVTHICLSQNANYTVSLSADVHTLFLKSVHVRTDLMKH